MFIVYLFMKVFNYFEYLISNFILIVQSQGIHEDSGVDDAKTEFTDMGRS